MTLDDLENNMDPFRCPISSLFVILLTNDREKKKLLTNHWNISDLTLCPLLLSVIHIRHFQGLSLFSQIQIMVAMNTPQYMQPFIESNTSLWGIRNAISPCMF